MLKIRIHTTSVLEKSGRLVFYGLCTVKELLNQQQSGARDLILPRSTTMLSSKPDLHLAWLYASVIMSPHTPSQSKMLQLSDHASLLPPQTNACPSPRTDLLRKLVKPGPQVSSRARPVDLVPPDNVLQGCRAKEVFLLQTKLFTLHHLCEESKVKGQRLKQ